MERVPVDDLESELSRRGVERRGLTDPLGAAGVAINHYRITPGEGLPGGLHAHTDQEELFYVLTGAATFEFLGAGGEPETVGGEVTVAAGEAIRFAPGEFKSGRNGSEEDLVVLAVGAPRDGEDVCLPVDCPECGHGEMRVNGHEEVELVCPDCGTERVPAPCPECDGDDLRVTLDDRTTPEGGEEAVTVVVCADCGATFDDPPFRA